MTVFVTVVEQQSFTNAARNLGIAKSTVSRHISDLEERLGVRLLARTTRKMRPTDLGLAYYERSARILADAEEADRAVSDLGNAPKGKVRVTSARSFASRYLVGPISSFMEQYPEVQIDLDLEDRLVDLIAEGFDIAIRVSKLDDSSLVTRRFGASRAHVVCSPDYIAKHGKPKHPEDLVNHDCVRRLGFPGSATWHLTSDDGDISIPVSGRMQCNDGEAMVSYLVTGKGVGLVPDFLVRDEVAKGKLVHVLPEWSRTGMEVHALFAHRRLMSTRVRLFLDHIAASFKETPWRW